MKKLRYFVLFMAMTASLTISVWAAPKGPKAGSEALFSPTPSVYAIQATAVDSSNVLPTSFTYQDYSQYTDMNTEELWNQFSQAEAYKKLYELQEKALRQQIKLLEEAGGIYYYYNDDYSTAYSQLTELKNQQYLLKTKKEQYEWQKKQAENYLKLMGIKTGKKELQYALYAGTLSPSGLSYEELSTQRYSLQMQEEQLKLQKKNLEYQYQMNQITDSEFLSQYASAVRQKEMLKMQREQYDAELHIMIGTNGPGLALPKIP